MPEPRAPRKRTARLRTRAAVAGLATVTCLMPATALAAPAVGGGSCTNPAHTLRLDPSNAQNNVELDGFFVSNGTWNYGKYEFEQTTFVCGFRNWHTVAKIDNATTEVKSYPNVHKDFDVPTRINRLSTITSSFAHKGPDVGIYNFAYDIWLNGIADRNSTELMIWTDNRGQTPAGSPQGEFVSGGRTYSVFETDRYIAYVDKSNTRSGTLNLREFLDHAVSQGWLRASSTIGQIGYGPEIVQTDGRAATFEVDDFSLTTG